MKANAGCINLKEHILKLSEHFCALVHCGAMRRNKNSQRTFSFCWVSYAERFTPGSSLL